MALCPCIGNMRNRRNPPLLLVELRQPPIKIEPDVKALPGKFLKMAGIFNRKQKICFWAGAAVIGAMILYPPWIARLTDRGTIHSQRRVGYAWLWTRPELPWEPYGARFTLEMTVNVPRLSGQCAVTAVVALSLVVALKTGRNRSIRVLIIVVDALVVIVALCFFIQVRPAGHRAMAMGLLFAVPLTVLALFELRR